MTTSPYIQHWRDLQSADDAHYPGSDELLSIGSPFGRAFGFKRVAIHHEVLPPGRRTSWPHAEKTEDEFIYVIEGAPDVWLDGALHRLQPGDGVGFSAGDGMAHTFINNTETDVRLLVVGDVSRTDNQIHYPLHPERNAALNAQHWAEVPARSLGTHDGLPDALRQGSALNDLAESYVHLVLAIGQHDSGYVDAYYGPAEWKEQAQKLPLEQVLDRANTLVAQFDQCPPAGPDEALRQQLLGLHIRAAHTYVRKLMGETMTFDQESQALYDAVSPTVTEAELDGILAELSDLLPGEGALSTRMVAFNQAFAIPRDRLDAVFSAAIAESRARTKQFIDLPDDESFRLEYVTDQVWSGYNWYLGNSSSLIQVNTDFPMQISRAVDLASHEGYPGHHVFHLLGEKHLVREKGWVEYSIFPLYSPLAFLSEGSANYGISVVFPEAERLAFERDVLFPLAGLDGTQVERYYQVQHALQKLSYAGNMVAQRYLDGQITREAAIALLVKYSLQEEARAAQRIRFIEANRSYVINYNLGQDVVKDFVERRAGDGGPAALWKAFTELLLEPRSASMMHG